MTILFLIGRIIYGGFFLMSAYNHFFRLPRLAGYAASKGVPSPKLAVLGSGALILLGGLGVMFGVYIKLAVFCLVVFLLVVSFKMHTFWSVADPTQHAMEMVNFNKNLALAAAALMLLAIPEPWVYGLAP